jgi:hypothetical protein
MTLDKGIRSFFPGIRTVEEIKEQAEAKAVVKAKLDQFNNSEFKLRAAPAPPINVEINLPKETKDNQEAVKKDNELRRKKQLMRSWGLDKEKQKDKDHYKKLVDFGIDNSSVKYTGSRQHLYDEWDKTDLPAKNNLKKEEVILDPKHPDGFRFAGDNDLYKNYGDTPVRYVQEIRYKYKDGPVPTDSVVKTFDGADASTFPSDPEQKKALAKYQMTYNKLSPLQKKQLETLQKRKK